MNQASSLRQWAQSSPSLYALHTPSKSYTWSELDQAVSQLALSLKRQGIQPGNVLTCVGKNSPELVMVYLACLELGAVCAVTMPQTEAEFNQKLMTLYGDLTEAKIWVCDKVPQLVAMSNVSLKPINAGLTTNEFDLDILASIIFTSGSTGTAKAVAHTSRQHLASAEGLLQRFCFTQQDTWLLSLPMCHVSGLAIVYRWLQQGATLKIGVGDLAEDIKGVTHASLVATQLKRLMEADVKLELTHVLLGGSHVPLELSQRAAKHGIETWFGYGMTEAASTVTAKRIDTSYTAGPVLPKRKLRLDGQRIFIGGETLASGYFYQGSLRTLTEDGWFDSKDLGEMDGQELKIIGRADNLFISGGENIHCEEIEMVLNQLEGIDQSFVIPIDDPEYGQRPVAVIQTQTEFSKREIEAHLIGKLSRLKHPKEYYLLPSALINNGIKVSRKKVRQWLCEQLVDNNANQGLQ